MRQPIRYSTYKKQYQLLPALDTLKIRIDAIEDPNSSNLVLKKILVNLRNLGERTDELMNYFKAGTALERSLRTDNDYSKFVSHQVINSNVFTSNFGLESSVFRASADSRWAAQQYRRARGPRVRFDRPGSPARPGGGQCDALDFPAPGNTQAQLV